MCAPKVETVFVLGAGFSKEAKLPTTDEFANALFDPGFATELDEVITDAVKEFLIHCFRWEVGTPLPSFEEMFTMIDISTGTGHNLGRSFAPKRLRAIRRMLIYRLFSILDRRFERSDNIQKILDCFVKKPNTSHFVVLNWDIVLESHLYGLMGDARVDYSVDIIPWDAVYLPADPRIVGVAKVHGSSNWVYCDNCRSLFFGQHGKLALAIRAGLIKADFRSFNEGFANARFDHAIGLEPAGRNCRNCQTAVGPHIATFSFRKAFRTHAFASSWLAAEQMLTQAKQWLFLGYSLPDADFEFKNLLKTCQLKWKDRAKYPKEITVVTLDSPSVEKRFRAFFGSDIQSVVQDGIAGYAARL
jgi:hypothetical protein